MWKREEWRCIVTCTVVLTKGSISSFPWLFLCSDRHFYFLSKNFYCYDVKKLLKGFMKFSKCFKVQLTLFSYSVDQQKKIQLLKSENEERKKNILTTDPLNSIELSLLLLSSFLNTPFAFFPFRILKCVFLWLTRDEIDCKNKQKISYTETLSPSR